MFRCHGNPSAASVSSAQQCASDSPDPTERVREKNYIIFFNSSVHVHNFLWFLFHLSPLYHQHSALLSHNCLLSPLSMTSSRSPPPAALADTQTTGNKNQISHYQRLISKRYLTFNERFTFNAIAYQFFAGSRLHVVGIRISVLQCVTTLWRANRQRKRVETQTLMRVPAEQSCNMNQPNRNCVMSYVNSYTSNPKGYDLIKQIYTLIVSE